jgi:hypothetical protein
MIEAFRVDHHERRVSVLVDQLIHRCDIWRSVYARKLLQA